MRVWAVCNQKGGVGKTTTAVTLAGLLAARGHAVLLVDTDPQGSLTGYFGLDPQQIEPSLYRLFCERSSEPLDLIRETRVQRLALLPSSTALAALERQLGARPGLGLVLNRAVGAFAPRFAYVLIDGPPALGVLMVNALAACDHLVIPVQTEYLALKGLERMLHTVEAVGRSLKRDIPFTVVPTLYDARTRACAECLARLQRDHAAHLWPGVIPVDTQFREAARVGLPLSHYAPRARGVQACERLLEALLATSAPAVQAALPPTRPQAVS